MKMHLVVKYFFSMRGMNSHLNFDLNLAKDQSDQNPVFYIQYALARINSIEKLSLKRNVNLFRYVLNLIFVN